MIVMLKELIDKLYKHNHLTRDELIAIIENTNGAAKDYLIEKAGEIRAKHYSNKVYLRGLIEFTNYCKNNCYYCGIRRDNKHAERYRLSASEILACCKTGYELGYRTFVLQGGEDNYFTDDRITEIIRSIKVTYPACAVTLSIGEKSSESYQKYYDAGADRYLLRHETATDEHYARLHPKELSLSARRQCLYELKGIGYQVGAGFMVGSPCQTAENLAADLLFLSELQPEMVGIGPFIPHQETVFRSEKPGSIDLTLLMLALTRLLLPKALIPATTALATLHPAGREMGLRAGANVVMPNLSPPSVRKKYSLYNNKSCTGEEAAEGRILLEKNIQSAGFVIDPSRGDHLECRHKQNIRSDRK